MGSPEPPPFLDLVEQVGLLIELEKAEKRVVQLEQALRDKAWPAVENLRGYQAALSNGCEPSTSRGRHFGAHVDAILDHFREALSATGEDADG